MNCKDSVYNHKRRNPECKEDLRMPRQLRYAKPFVKETREEHKSRSRECITIVKDSRRSKRKRIVVNVSK